MASLVVVATAPPMVSEACNDKYILLKAGQHVISTSKGLRQVYSSTPRSRQSETARDECETILYGRTDGRVERRGPCDHVADFTRPDPRRNN